VLANPAVWIQIVSIATRTYVTLGTPKDTSQDVNDLQKFSTIHVTCHIRDYDNLAGKNDGSDEAKDGISKPSRRPQIA
jgi:hypothetical protein